MKKKIEKKINRAYIQVPTKLKIKSPSPFRKNQTKKHKKILQRRAKTRSLGAKSFTRNNNLWPCLRKYLKFNHKT